MRRIISCLTAMVLLLTLYACKSEEATAVEALIETIGTVTETSGDAIDKARAAYNLLTEEDRKTISNHGTLEAAEIAYDRICAEKIDDKIGAIGEINEESGERIAEARRAYDGLSKSQQSYVAAYSNLLKAEKDYNAYIIGQAREALQSLMSANTDLAEAKQRADAAMERLTQEQRTAIETELGSYDEIFLTARLHSTQAQIDGLTYDGGEPTAEELKEMLAAVNARKELDEEQAKLVDTKNLERALDAFLIYQKNREKKDKLYIRKKYIDGCEEISCDDLKKYPKSYKGSTFSMKVMIPEDRKPEEIQSGNFMGTEEGTGQSIKLKDGRKIKEPKLAPGTVLTLYGTFQGMDTVKVREDGSGLFGSNLFAKVREQYEVPEIRFVYTDMDNLGVIATGDPGAETVAWDQEAEDRKEQLLQLIKEEVSS